MGKLALIMYMCASVTTGLLLQKYHKSMCIDKWPINYVAVGMVWPILGLTVVLSTLTDDVFIKIPNRCNGVKSQ